MKLIETYLGSEGSARKELASGYDIVVCWFDGWESRCAEEGCGGCFDHDVLVSWCDIYTNNREIASKINGKLNWPIVKQTEDLFQLQTTGYENSSSTFMKLLGIFPDLIEEKWEALKLAAQIGPCRGNGEN